LYMDDGPLELIGFLDDTLQAPPGMLHLFGADVEYFVRVLPYVLPERQSSHCSEVEFGHAVSYVFRVLFVKIV